jgi:serine/threonine protein kinase
MAFSSAKFRTIWEISTFMDHEADQLEAAFARAVEQPSLEARAAFVQDFCGKHPSLEQRLQQLLVAYDENGDEFLEQAPLPDGASSGNGALAARFAALKAEEAGDRIADYKLLQQIGEGGFGVVWMAEQERPVRRRVALKIIKMGMDTKEVVARFEQERQALAMMEHPNIAKVFDAGATAYGRPFFVMELVRGVKITDYCDEANLSTSQRLRLFMAVCQAVQHAHQKGIIHRDLKPSNILVTLHDGVPVPKVIDFGVAKATAQQRLTDLTLFTKFEQMVGTPLYMAPEQAELSGLDVDTRSDIYSLGVLLYELLTGRTPFDPEKLMKAGYDEMRRVIREEEPQKPSTFVSTMRDNDRPTVPVGWAKFAVTLTGS